MAVSSSGDQQLHCNNNKWSINYLNQFTTALIPLFCRIRNGELWPDLTVFYARSKMHMEVFTEIST